jgi:hypothetical protein
LSLALAILEELVEAIALRSAEIVKDSAEAITYLDAEDGEGAA